MRKRTYAILFLLVVVLTSSKSLSPNINSCGAGFTVLNLFNTAVVTSVSKTYLGRTSNYEMDIMPGQAQSLGTSTSLGTYTINLNFDRNVTNGKAYVYNNSSILLCLPFTNRSSIRVTFDTPTCATYFVEVNNYPCGINP